MSQPHSPTNDGAAALAAFSLVADGYHDLRPSLFDLLPDLHAVRAIQATTDLGPLWLHVDDRVITPWIRHYHTWEPDEGTFVRGLLKPGMTVVDIGANVGYSSLLFARLVGPTGRVLAIEPDTANYALLCANIWQGGARNVEPIRAAAHRVNGTTPFSLSDVNTGDHRSYAHSAAHRIVQVRTVRLDDLLRSDTAIDLIKLDIQGTEHVAVQGMEATIRRACSRLVVEFWPVGIAEFGDRPIDVLSYYRSLDLSIALLDDADGHRRPAGDRALVESIAASERGFATLVLTVGTGNPR